MEVENAFDGNLKWDKGSALPSTIKINSMEHGIGLKNVKDVANRYFGDLDIKVKDAIFKATVLLQEEENNENHNTDD